MWQENVLTFNNEFIIVIIIINLIYQITKKKKTAAHYSWWTLRSCGFKEHMQIYNSAPECGHHPTVAAAIPMLDIKKNSAGQVDSCPFKWIF